MLKKASAGATSTGQYIGGAGGVAGARGWCQDVIVNMPTVHVLSSSNFHTWSNCQDDMNYLSLKNAIEHRKLSEIVARYCRYR